MRELPWSHLYSFISSTEWAQQSSSMKHICIQRQETQSIVMKGPWRDHEGTFKKGECPQRIPRTTESCLCTISFKNLPVLREHRIQLTGSGDSWKVRSVSTEVVGGTSPGHDMLRAIRLEPKPQSIFRLTWTAALTPRRDRGDHDVQCGPGVSKKEGTKWERNGGERVFMPSQWPKGDGGTAPVTTCPSPKKGRNLTGHLRDY